MREIQKNNEMENQSLTERSASDFLQAKNKEVEKAGEIDEEICYDRIIT